MLPSTEWYFDVSVIAAHFLLFGRCVLLVAKTYPSWFWAQQAAGPLAIGLQAANIFKVYYINTSCYGFG